MYDISAAGNVTVTVSFASGFPVTFHPEDFSDSGCPVRFGRHEVGRPRIDLNGNLFDETCWRPFMVELTPIPNTASDKQLKMALLDQWKDGAKEAGINSLKIEWSLSSQGSTSTWGGSGGRKSSVTFYDGMISQGSFGNDVTAEGRFSSAPYTFHFADIDGKWNSLSDVQMGAPAKSDSSNQSASQPKAQPKKQSSQQKPSGYFPYVGMNADGSTYSGIVRASMG